MKIQNPIKWSGLALLTLLLPCSLLAKPIVIRINDVPNAAPVIEVQGAPNGYDINTVLPNDPAIEDGALITLFGVNNYFADPDAAFPDWSGRFVIPEAPNPLRHSVDIVWVEHDFDVFGNGDLRIGFNSAFPGTYYANPNEFNGAENLGVVTDQWVEVYANETIVILFKPHTYRLRS